VTLLLLVASATLRATTADGVAPSVLQAALTAPAATCQQPDLDGRRLARFYREVSPTPLWVDETGPLPRAVQLRAALRQAEDEGLSVARYGLGAIEARWQAVGPVEQTCLDLLLTAAFERYARDLAQGQLGAAMADRTWHLQARGFDPAATLAGASPDADLAGRLDGLSPSHGLSRRLRAALARYRQLAEQGGWDTTLSGDSLRDGAPVAALRERLRREGDLEAVSSAAERSRDPALTEGVRRFQRRHGLSPDGIVGPRTLAALNTPATVRTAQLRRAMERLRWMPRDLGPHYVWVNTAAFELAVIEDDRSVLGMRAIVGTRDQATPSFTATLSSLVINPYWRA